MNAKLLIVLAAILALTQVDAQGGAPALTSLASKIESIESSVTGSPKTIMLNSASSAYSRISAAIATAPVSQTSDSSSATTDVSSSRASDAASSAASNAHSSVTSAASDSTHSSAPSAANLVGGDNYLVQLSALAAAFVVSFVAVLA